MDLQHQVRCARVAIGVSDGIGEGFCAVAIAAQGFEVGIRSIQRVGVGTVGIEHQGAVGASKGSGCHRPAGHSVCPLSVVG